MWHGSSCHYHALFGCILSFSGPGVVLANKALAFNWTINTLTWLAFKNNHIKHAISTRTLVGSFIILQGIKLLFLPPKYISTRTFSPRNIMSLSGHRNFGRFGFNTDLTGQTLPQTPINNINSGSSLIQLQLCLHMFRTCLHVSPEFRFYCFLRSRMWKQKYSLRYTNFRSYC